jgi:hypothetical protein
MMSKRITIFFMLKNYGSPFFLGYPLRIFFFAGIG